MAYDYTQIMDAQWQRLQADAAEQVAELEAARHAEDADRTNYAAQRILEIDAQRAALASRATQYASQLQGQAHAAQANPYNLSLDEMEVAKTFTSDDRLSVNDRMRIYAEQKAKYQHARATG